MKHEFYQGMKVVNLINKKTYTVGEKWKKDDDDRWGVEESSGWIRVRDTDWCATEKLNMEEIKEIMKTFTKSDLRNGDKVVCRNGDERFVLLETESLHNKGGDRIGGLACYYSTLVVATPKNASSFDIMKVYRNGVKIWEREEKSQAQLDYEKLMEQIKDLQTKAEELKSRLF